MEYIPCARTVVKIVVVYVVCLNITKVAGFEISYIMLMKMNEKKLYI